MKSIFVDVNILLEILFNRKLADECKQQLTDPESRYSISALSVHIVRYMGERYKLSRLSVDEILSVWNVLDVTSRELARASERYGGIDFEDCLQAACAEFGKCETILTLDSHFQEHSFSTLPVTIIK